MGDPVRGDVVILRPHASNGKEYYIKRVVGAPGDTIRFSSGNVLLKQSGKTNFVQLDERYLSLANNGKTFLPIDVKETEFTVPEGEYFVVGDNRNNSKDSRNFGAVDKSFITGKVLFRGWPLDKITLFNSTYWPQYQN